MAIVRIPAVGVVLRQTDEIRTFLDRHLIDELLRDARTVDVQHLILIPHAVTGYTDHPLDEVAGFVRRHEHHHVAVLRFADVEQLGAEHGQANAICVFVHEDEVADLEGRHHRLRRNLVRLEEKTAQHQHEEQHREERPRVFDQQRLFENLLGRLDVLALAGAFAVGLCGADAARFQRSHVGQPDHAADDHRPAQNQWEVEIHQRSTRNAARNASCGISTRPTCFIRFLPAFCFSSSFFFRVTSPP